MSLTNAQLATLKTAIQADSTANGYRLAGDSASLLAWCNAAASPAQLAWSVSVDPTTSALAPSYSTFDTMTAGKQVSWTVFIRFTQDFSKNKVRKWVTDVWGNATAGSNAEAILQSGTYNATNAQVALGGAVTTTGTVSALNLSFTGSVGQTDVNVLINS